MYSIVYNDRMLFTIARYNFKKDEKILKASNKLQKFYEIIRIRYTVVCTI